ncbi:CHAP domain-containing protein [Leucobacter sp. HNU]|uniref:CHAP domain-containing protein n=1 Tax=Leucobacter sp. HNU TaxID=3236805 RepID=UPI003A80E765
MQTPAKAFIVTLVASVTFAIGAAPASAAPEPVDFAAAAAEVVQPPAQTLRTQQENVSDRTLDTMLQMSDVANAPHGFDVEKTIAAAESEVDTSRPTGWSAPGECIMSAQRWILAGGGKWVGSGDPVANYAGATRLAVSDAQPGDVIQYENIASPTSWVTGVHTVLVTGVNKDGTFTIIQSNSPGGSGLVTKKEHWTPEPPPASRPSSGASETSRDPRGTTEGP